MVVDVFGLKRIEMGIISKLMRLTPFYDRYNLAEQRKNENLKRQMEEKLLPLITRFYKTFISESDLVFDIGANVGNRVAALLQCNAKVIAIEPQEECVKVLQERFKDRILIEQLGLSNESGYLVLYKASDNTVSSFSETFIKKTKDRFKYSEWESTVQVPVTTLDKLIEKYGIPKFCKIDVEGFELNVLQGLTQAIPFISFEYCVPEMQENMMACVKRLHYLSPQALFNYSIEESMEWALDDWMNFDDFILHLQKESFKKTLFGDIYFKI